MPWLFYSFLITIYVGVSVTAAFFPGSGFHYMPVFTHGSRNKQSLTLTFDDGPDPQFTPLILDILRKHRIKAGFFIIGKNIRGNEAILKRITQEGHTLGNHSWTHSYFWDLYSSGRMTKELEQTNTETEIITGKRIKLFRPPYGVINPMVARAIRNTGLMTVAWSFRSFDTTSFDAEQLIRKTLHKVRAGDVMLFHDNAKLTAGILEKIIVSLQEGGFNFISLDEMLKLQAYENS